MLTYRFRQITMKADETFDEFYALLNEIVNSSFNLCERIPKNRIVRKVMRSLPKKFKLMVIVIEEIQNLHSLRIKELVDSL
jgi:Cdc6-like AAA superfamily ATPase